MCTLKLYTALRLTDFGVSSLKIAITPKHAGAKYRGVDNPLARPGRKQATATQLRGAADK